MDYYEGSIKKTEFLTTSELAEKLKMNVQVITRKVQSGEIEAFKIGKDWRIPEQAVFAWLEKQSNKIKKKQTPEATTPKVTEQLPTQPSKRKFLLEYILAQFETNREYPETDVDNTIKKFHDDFLQVRREFVNENMMEKVNGKYVRNAEYRLSDY